MSDETASLNIKETGDQDIGVGLTKGCASVDAPTSNSKSNKKRALEESAPSSNSVEGTVHVIDNTSEKNTGGDGDNGDNSDDRPPKKARTKVEDKPKPFETEKAPAPAASSTSTSTSSPSTTKSIFGSSTTAGFSGFSTTSIFGSTASASSQQQTDDQNGASTQAPTSVFGSTPTSSTSIFGTAATSTSTGFGASSGTSTGFGSTTITASPGIFGSSSNTTGTTSIFTLGDTQNKSTDSPAKSPTPVVTLPEADGPIMNGEENEKTIITVRAKLYKLTKVVAKPEEPQEKKKEVKKTVGIQMATKVGQDEQEDSAGGTAEGSKTASSGSATGMGAMDWKEVGIGPLRVLTDDTHARIVQRRENTPGGQGTKLILNLPLRDECSVEKRGDKFLRLAAFEVIEDGDADKEIDKDEESKDEDSNVKFAPVQYLFKVKTMEEADSLLAAIKKFCGKK